ncbi:MAG: hypothetical protein K5787_13830 [Lentisphaeria bacterium]|nr:hypothetical protein [Lentisphaeria bacterium]
MFDNWFTTRCMTLVDSDGYALQGEAKTLANKALDDAKLAKCKVWADKECLMWKKAPGLFSKDEPLVDAQGNRLRICGHLVKSKANYCSKCSADAPGGWWRCGECGKPVGNESTNCPHCGHPLHPEMRQDLSTGSWRQRQGVFAERFDLSDLNVLIPYGLNIQENQRGLLLEGGELTQVLEPGHYACEDFRSEEVKKYGEHCIIFVDMSEFSLPLNLTKVWTKGSMTCDVHLELTLQIVSDLAHGKSFIRNLMGRRLLFETGQETIPYELGYSEIMHVLEQMTDDVVRRFCVDKTVDELFKDDSLRKELEDKVKSELQGRLDSLGLCLVRLGKLDFKSETFDKLREQEGEVEEQRRRNEFMLAADDMANDATKRKMLTEQEMEDYMADLAKRAKISEGERERELERVRRKWQYDRLLEEYTYDSDLADEKRRREMKVRLDELNNKIVLDDKEREARYKARLEELNRDIEYSKTRRDADYKQRLAGKQNEYDMALMEEKIHEVNRRIEEADDDHHRKLKNANIMQDLRLKIEKERAEIMLKKEREEAEIEIAKKREEVEIETTDKWLDIKKKKNTIDADKADRDADTRIKEDDAAAQRKVTIAQGLNGVSAEAILAAEGDSGRRSDILELYRIKMSAAEKKGTSPEALILAALAKRGDPEASEVVARMDREHRAEMDKAVQENKQLFEDMLKMNERMFNQVVENFSRPAPGNTTTQIIK